MSTANTSYYTDTYEKPDPDEYAICKKRGHKAGGRRLLTNPPYDVCKHCGTPFRYERVLHELKQPWR